MTENNHKDKTEAAKEPARPEAQIFTLEQQRAKRRKKKATSVRESDPLQLASEALLQLIHQMSPQLELDQLAGLFALYARDLAEISLLEAAESIDKDEQLRALKRFLCERILEKSPTLERLKR